MFRLILAVVTVLPLIGMYRMEQGAFGADIWQTGYPNGATVAYLQHLIVFWIAFEAIARWQGRATSTTKVLKPTLTSRKAVNPREALQSQKFYLQVATCALLFQLFFCAFTFGPLGAYRVIFYGVNRGEFRATLGSLGTLAFFQAQFLSPMLCAMVAAIYSGLKTRKDATLLIANCALTALNIGMWGYRAAAAINLFPALLVLFPSIKISKKIVFTMCVLISSLVVCQHIFGDADLDKNAINSIWDRATTGTANSAWKVWDLHLGGHSFPSLWPTFWSILPNRFNELMGIWDQDSVDWYKFSFSGIMTTVVKDYDLGVDIRLSNVTVTAFCTGLIAFGTPGCLVMSVFSGAIAAASYLWLERTRRRKDFAGVALASTYAVTSVWAFLNNGDPVCLFNVASLVYYCLAVFCCRLLLAWRARDVFTFNGRSQVSSQIGWRGAS